MNRPPGRGSTPGALIKVPIKKSNGRGMGKRLLRPLTAPGPAARTGQGKYFCSEREPGLQKRSLLSPERRDSPGVEGICPLPCPQGQQSPRWVHPGQGGDVAPVGAQPGVVPVATPWWGFCHKRLLMCEGCSGSRPQPGLPQGLCEGWLCSPGGDAPAAEGAFPCSVGFISAGTHSKSPRDNPAVIADVRPGHRQCWAGTEGSQPWALLGQWVLLSELGELPALL